MNDDTPEASKKRKRVASDNSAKIPSESSSSDEAAGEDGDGDDSSSVSSDRVFVQVDKAGLSTLYDDSLVAQGQNFLNMMEQIGQNRHRRNALFVSILGMGSGASGRRRGGIHFPIHEDDGELAMENAGNSDADHARYASPDEDKENSDDSFGYAISDDEADDDELDDDDAMYLSPRAHLEATYAPSGMDDIHPGTDQLIALLAAQNNLQLDSNDNLSQSSGLVAPGDSSSSDSASGNNGPTGEDA